MASSGQGGIQGTIAADLHQALAYMMTLWIVFSCGCRHCQRRTHFNQGNYFADRSLSERLITTQKPCGVALARAIKPSMDRPMRRFRALMHLLRHAASGRPAWVPRAQPALTATRWQALRLIRDACNGICQRTEQTNCW